MKSNQGSRSEKTTKVSQYNYRELYQSYDISVGSSALLCTEGPHKGLRVALDKELLVVGRAEWSDVHLPDDPLVSRQHCEIHLSEEGITIRDCKSNNGTFINQIQIFEAPLHQSFTVGNSHFILQSESTPQKISIRYHDLSGNLVGCSRKVRKIFSMLPKLSQSNVSILLHGETGTGKSSVAQALHEQSNRAAYDMVTVNCGALTSSLIEASLFGYEKGAFTGADRQHIGFFEQAHQSTLFLDEIAELPLELQPKLLDVLERKKLYRLGGTKEIDVDFRLITATHADMRKLAEQKKFRQDLFYRLAVAELTIPPLRERYDDLPLIAKFLLDQLEPQKALHITDDAIKLLRQYTWPGNIREFRNIIERTLVFLEGNTITRNDLFLPQKVEAFIESSESSESSADSLKKLLHIEEERILRECLQELQWDLPSVIKRLKISRASLYNKLQKFDIQRP